MLVDRLRLWNPWWEQKEYERAFVERSLTKEIMKYVDDINIKVITGPRRAGKTTLLFQIIDSIVRKGTPENVMYVDLEDPALSEVPLEVMYEEYIRDMRPSSPHIFLDEIQGRKGWEKEVRILSDRERVPIFLTGSTSTLLATSSASTLGGRAIDFTLYPLSLNEMEKGLGGTVLRRRATLEGLIDDYLVFGGYPAVFTEKDEDKKMKLLAAYIKTSVTRDVANLLGEPYSLLLHLLKHIANSVGGLTSINSLRKAMDISFERVERIVEAFINSYILIPAEFMSYSEKVRRKMPKKFYFVDNGLLNTLSFKVDRGKLLENMIASELVKMGFKIFYYRGKRECDLVAVKEDKAIPLQVSWEITGSNAEREKEGLKEAERRFRTKGFIITRENVVEVLERLRSL